jgi:hypothetical protein
LIRKLDYSKEVKKRFEKQVGAHLYATHEGFLSNPLLCTMMLLTYDQFSEIPSKMHLFYSQAFDVLFRTHDATKPSFRRQFATNLQLDDFRRLFSTFCVMTYVDERSSIHREIAMEMSKTAIEFERLPVAPKDFLSDLSDKVCILLRDRDYFTFLHRSFQEYFVACFIRDRDVEGIIPLIELAVKRRDETIDLLSAMSMDALESKYFVSHLDKLIEAMRPINIDKEPSRLFSLIYVGFQVSKALSEVRFITEYGGTRAPFHPVHRIMQDVYKMGSPFLVERGAYRKALEAKGLKFGEFQFVSPSDDHLLGTPIIEFLRNFVDDAHKLARQLTQKGQGRSTVLKNMFSKAKVFT